MVTTPLLLAFAAAVLWGSVLVSAQPQVNFQFYKLSLIWPNTFCIQVNCINPIPNHFTVHGFWPTFQNGNVENPVPPYDPINNLCFNNPVGPGIATSANTLAPILQGLNAKWPTLRAANTNQGFWQLEWIRHGICSDYGDKPFAYYTIALNLANDARYNPLTAMGVQPSNIQHQISTLLANVQRNVGFLPQISCRSVGQYRYLKEFRLCFVRTRPPAYLQDCPNVIDNACGSVQNFVLIP